MTRLEALEIAYAEYRDANRAAYNTFSAELARINKEYPQ